MTFPERLLWSRLRRGALGTEVRRQVPIGAYVVDFYVPAARLVIEVDGRSHDGRGAADAAREAALVGMGLRVVRVLNAAVIGDVVAVVAVVAGLGGALVR
jgi:very-short-patch-repair endonuclease